MLITYCRGHVFGHVLGYNQEIVDKLSTWMYNKYMDDWDDIDIILTEIETEQDCIFSDDENEWLEEMEN